MVTHEIHLFAVLETVPAVRHCVLVSTLVLCVGPNFAREVYLLQPLCPFLCPWVLWIVHVESGLVSELGPVKERAKAVRWTYL